MFKPTKEERLHFYAGKQLRKKDHPVRVVLFVRVQHDVRENIFIIETWNVGGKIAMFHGHVVCRFFPRTENTFFYFTMVFFPHVLLYFSISYIGAISVDGTTLWKNVPILLPFLDHTLWPSPAHSSGYTRRSSVTVRLSIFVMGSGEK